MKLFLFHLRNSEFILISDLRDKVDFSIDRILLLFIIIIEFIRKIITRSFQLNEDKQKLV
jgi:hypothetical protein